VNDARKRAMARKVSAALNGDVRGKTIALLGLTFKPNTDDMRDSPSIPLIKGLVDGGASVIAFDPVGREQAEPLLPKIEYAANAEEVAEQADALVIVTEWDQFRALDLPQMASRMRGKALIDLRNIYDRVEAERAGLTYRGVGRGRP
jgi:UDPglucose 6-dehydrogenase